LVAAATVESIDFDRVLPLHVPRTPIGPQPEPDNARLVWRLRGWEITCLPGQARKIWRWLHAHRLGEQAVSLEHDVTVWRYPNRRQEIGYMQCEHRDRRKHPWVVVPTLAPLLAKPPTLHRRAIPYFDKFQAVIDAGHQGREPQRGETEPPCCPMCSREQGTLVPWPCPMLARWMPKWLKEYWAEHIADVLKDKERTMPPLARRRMERTDD
jgi:hypothetical protein